MSTNPPSIKETAFDCPHCGAYTTQYWYITYANKSDKNSIPHIPTKEELSNFLEDRETPKDVKQNIIRWVERISQGHVTLKKRDSSAYTWFDIENLHLSKCYNCNKVAVWIHKNLVFIIELEENNPRVSRLPVDLGAVEIALGNHAAAIPLLEQTVKGSPGSSEYRFNLALAYGGVGRHEDALREVRKAVDLANPASPQYFQWLALHHSRAGDFGRAVWWLEELNRRFPTAGSTGVDVNSWLTVLRRDMRERGQRPNPPPDL